ncbi:MAG: hypothetical protein AAF570_00810 [Bacteroidota bacterium]
MKHQLSLTHLVFCVTFTFGLLFWNPAAAQRMYSIDLDICHADIDNEGTGNTIMVAWMDAAGNILKSERKNGIAQNCLGADATFKYYNERSSAPLKLVRISTDGDDGLFIDEIQCYRSISQSERGHFSFKERKLVGQHDRENGGGFCLSTDPGDANGGWKGRCTKGCKKEFYIDFFNFSQHEPRNRYSIKLDNCHSDLKNEGTGNKILVEFLDKNGKVVGRDSKNGVSENCWSADAEFSLSTNSKVSDIRVTTNGDDGYYIDEVSIYAHGKEVRHYGGENGGGWCLSTDPEDGRRSWKGKCDGTGNAAKKSVTFNVW